MHVMRRSRCANPLWAGSRNLFRTSLARDHGKWSRQQAQGKPQCYCPIKFKNELLGVPKPVTLSQPGPVCCVGEPE